MVAHQAKDAHCHFRKRSTGKNVERTGKVSDGRDLQTIGALGDGGGKNLRQALPQLAYHGRRATKRRESFLTEFQNVSAGECQPVARGTLESWTTQNRRSWTFSLDQAGLFFATMLRADPERQCNGWRD